MKLLLATLATLLFASIVYAEVPNGTLVFSNKPGTIVGNIAKKMTKGDQYTHIGIVIDGKVCDQDFPKSSCVPIDQYGKWRTINDYYVPNIPYSHFESQKLREAIHLELNQPYQLKNYLRPNSRPTKGTWCSPWVGKILNKIGRDILSEDDYREPQSIINKLKTKYSFSHRIRR